VCWACGSPQVGVSLGHPSGLAGPSELHVRGVKQVSSSIATGTATTPPPPPLPLAEQQLVLRQPPQPLPAAVTAAATSLTREIDR